jgi:hypothetical protein
MSSPIKGGSCSAIRRRFNALDYFVALHLVVRDQEVEGSNPFAPTISLRTNNLRGTRKSLSAWSRARRSVVQIKSPGPAYSLFFHTLTLIAWCSSTRGTCPTCLTTCPTDYVCVSLTEPADCVEPHAAFCTARRVS